MDNNDIISNFNDKYSFWNNEYTCDVAYKNEIYPSVIHAFYGSQTNKEYLKKKIKNSINFRELYENSLLIEKNEMIEKDKLILMEMLIRDKFTRNKNLKQKLLETENKYLINTYQNENKNNLFWGKVNKKGNNHIGNILMKIRNNIKEDNDLDNWLLFNKNIEKDEQLLTNFSIKIYKNNKFIEKIRINNKFYHIFDIKEMEINYTKEFRISITNKINGLYLTNLIENENLKLNKTQIKPYFDKKLKIRNKLKYDNLKIKIHSKYRVTKDNIKYLYNSIKQEIKIIKEKLNEEIDYLKNTIFIKGYNTPYIKKVRILDFFNKFGKIKDIKIKNDYREKNTNVFINFEDELIYEELLEKKILKHDNFMLFIEKAYKKRDRKRSYDNY